MTDTDKPTVDQVAWVFKKIVENWKAGGTFRHLIYDYMGFDLEDYSKLYLAGGMTINNAMVDFEGRGQGVSGEYELAHRDR